MRTLLICLLSCLFLGCAGPSSEKMEQNVTRAIQQNDRFHDAKRLVEINDQPFVGTERPLALHRKQSRPPFLKDRITLIEPSQNLASLVQRLSAMLPCQIHVAPIPGNKGGGAAQGPAGANSDTTFADPTGINSSLTMRVNYSGSVEGLLNTIAARFGLEWEYNVENKSIEFFKVKTKNFVLLMSPGKVKVETEITNESNISGTTSSGESSTEANIEGKQAIKKESELNPWATTLNSVRTMLSPFGSATINESISTLTVTDMPAILDKVEEYVKEINRKMGRQAAITLTVYSVNVTNESNASLDITASLKGAGFELMTTPATGIATEAASSITGTIVKNSSDLNGSSVLFKILQQWGKTSVMQRQHILTLHQKTVPVQVVRSQGYVAKSSTTATTNAGNTASLEPGSITTGFSMQVTPNILSNNSLILSYALTLSNLEELATWKLGKEGEETSMIQTPTVASRSFTQEVALKAGSMLVLSGFEMDSETLNKGAGILSYGRSGQKDRQLIVISIEVDNVKGAGEILDVTM